MNDEILARTPAGRWGQPDEIAGTAVYLASHASDFVTGAPSPESVVIRLGNSLMPGVGQSGVNDQHDSHAVPPAPPPADGAPIQPNCMPAAAHDDSPPCLATHLGAPRADRIRQEIVGWAKTVAWAGVYATLIGTFVGQVARVDGQSMAPTLADQDRLIVNKLAYRIGDPKIGDVVMLYYPVDPSKSFVKRVIAAEGDQVRIVNGTIYRNGAAMDDSFVASDFRSHEDWGPQIIPEGYYFVMGDHRNNSSDSRVWGPVPKKYIVGRVQFRWWPPGHARIFTHKQGSGPESDRRTRNP
jgi:signal peptidase I